jgi:hypothetical protein
MKKQKFLVVILLVFGLSGTVQALGPLGPPTAGLKTGQWGVAAEYAFSDSDVEVSAFGLSDTLEGVKSNVFLGQIGYGLSDDWELYGLVGAADHECDDLDPIEFDYDIAYGFGTKFTFAKDETLAWGVLFEMGWRQGDDSLYGVDVDIDYYEIFVAVGPTWKAAEGVRIYGGPFFYMLDGEIDTSISGLSADLEEESNFGGYVGAEFDLCPNNALYVEYQFTGDMQTIGAGINWKF